ncbi:hypothetical protein HanPI659440_Chr15g0616311 [Helianthus annuus]|nr:hypothetical protein HanPI659440_Chr15g0616311 [Helianthus annuus]
MIWGLVIMLFYDLGSSGCANGGRNVNKERNPGAGAAGAASQTLVAASPTLVCSWPTP